MKRKGTGLAAVCMAMILAVTGGIGTEGRMTSMAADKTVSSVTLSIDSKLLPGESLPEIAYNNAGGGSAAGDGQICVSNSSDRYSISAAEWVTSESKEMDVGDQPQMKVTLTPNSVGGDDYQFKGSYRSSNVTIKKGSFVSASKSGDDLVVRLKVRAIEGTFAAPENAYWKDNSRGTARWDAPDGGGTGKYQVELRRGSSRVYSTETTSRSYNFYPYMTKKGTYTFRVRTIAKTSNEKDFGDSSQWVESDEIYLAEEDVSDGSGQDTSSGIVSGGPGAGPSGNTSVGWLQQNGAWYYYYPDGSYEKNGWALVNGQWYLFGGDGKMLTGWQNLNGQTYYLSDSGAMVIGWIAWNGQWYYANPTQDQYLGCLLKDRWLQDGTKSYYLTASGAMAQGWIQVGENWYYFYPGSGEKAYNTYVGTFYVDENGIWVR